MSFNASSTLARNMRGVVYVEFLLCFIPVFLLFLGVVQLALISGAKLIVQHAAYRGARAASVILADDPKFYDDEPVGFLGQEESQSDSNTSESSGDGSKGTQSKTDALLDAIHTHLGINIKKGIALWKSAPSGQRYADIRRAVYTPLCALSPSFKDLDHLIHGKASAPDVASGLGDEHASRIVTGLLLYNDASTALRFPIDEDGNDFYKTSVVTTDPDLTLRVTHLYHCTIPLVSSIVCRSGRDLALDYLEARVTDDDKNPDAEVFDDLDYVPSRAGLTALLASRAHFFVLREQATVASQWAPYTYWKPEQ